MYKKVTLIKKVCFKTTFDLQVCKTFDQNEMNECFIEAFVKDILKVEMDDNKVVFTFEDRKCFSADVKYLSDFIGDKVFHTVLDLLEIAKIIEEKEPLDKTIIL